MLIHLRNLISPEAARIVAKQLESAPFSDGKATARGRTKEIKNNLQLDAAHPLAQQLATELGAHLRRSDIFNTVTQAKRFLPLRFCKYEVGMHYGDHLDLPIMTTPDGLVQRSDISMTLFLTPLADYEGGALAFNSEFGLKKIRGDIGDAVIYPSNTMHRVEPVEKGQRLVAISWIESMVREASKRSMLFELMMNLRQLEKRHGPSPETAAIRQTYYNLLRSWAET